MSASKDIASVAVIGAGTMGLGIAALCASVGVPVLLLDRAGPEGDRQKHVKAALEKLATSRPPMLDDPAHAARIAVGTVEDDLPRIVEADWVCEAVFEDLAIKRTLHAEIERHRRAGSVVSTNTSGIPLRAIAQGMPERFHRDVLVTHFFNPVKVMKLVELVPDPATDPATLARLATFCEGRLGKGVVYAKDTVNFVANRIGCYFMLHGLHDAVAEVENGLTVETVDAALGTPVGLPSTGLFGLVDLIGMDVMDFVAKNLAQNLSAADPSRPVLEFPPKVRRMADRGQFGRKAGAGFYRLVKAADGGRAKETFDLAAESWRPEQPAKLAAAESEAKTLLFADTPAGRLAWSVMGGTLVYAASLVPEIADDIVNVDRAMRWGYAWRMGPFELLDAVGPARVAERLKAEGRPVPRMIALALKASPQAFYTDGGKRFLGTDGAFHPVPGA